MISDLGAICRYLQALLKLVLRRSPPKTEVPCPGVIASLSGASSIRNQWPLLLTFPKPLGNHRLWSQPAKSRPFLWNKPTWRRLSSGKGPYLHQFRHSASSLQLSHAWKVLGATQSHSMRICVEMPLSMRDHTENEKA